MAAREPPADEDTLLALVLDLDGIPPSNESVEQVRYFTRAVRILRDALARTLGTREPLDASAEQLRHFRDAAAALLTEDAETLGSGHDTHYVPGWSRLAAAWLLLAYADVLLASAHNATGRGHPLFGMRAHELPLVAANGLVVAAAAVLEYRVSELVIAYDVLRARLDSLVNVDGSIVEYTSVLELRAAMLCVCAHTAATNAHDVEAYRLAADERGEVFVASRALLASTAWWIVVVRRALRNYFDPLLPVFFGSARPADTAALSTMPALPVPLVCLDERAPAVAAVLAYVRERATTYASNEHRAAFKKTALRYVAAVGDIEAATAVRMDGSRVTWREAISVRSSATAAEYLARARFERRSLAHWLESGLARRRPPCAATPGAGSGWPLEQLAAAHVLRTALNGEFAPLDWADTFVVMAREQLGYEERMLLGVSAGRPLIVQRLGRFGVLVPLPVSGLPATMRALERAVAHRLGAPSREAVFGASVPAYARARGRLYECRDFVDAFTLWALVLYEAFDAMLVPGRSARAWLERVLLPPPAVASERLLLGDAGPATFRAHRPGN